MMTQVIMRMKKMKTFMMQGVEMMKTMRSQMKVEKVRTMIVMKIHMRQISMMKSMREEEILMKAVLKLRVLNKMMTRIIMLEMM